MSTADVTLTSIRVIVQNVSIGIAGSALLFLGLVLSWVFNQHAMATAFGWSMFGWGVRSLFWALVEWFNARRYRDGHDSVYPGGPR